ncbi:MAG TPA: succinyldiaminopimelate transaminase [Beutenbergiaceae bacterium]|nr:succinyldiaminopimelate transaminase [Beutenbergiaceae bacterium]
MPYREKAASHPGGVVDLSIGTPIDPTPAAIQQELKANADAPGYPTAEGSPQLREAIVTWWARRRHARLTTDGVFPTIGSKELVGLLPSLLGLGPGDIVVIPEIAYPTYEVGARLAGAEVLASDDVATWGENPRVKLVWVNSPSNPTGRVASAQELAHVVAAARNIGAVVASDECYAELMWDKPWTQQGVPSVLSPEVSGGDHTGLIAAYSLSKQSNLAGYRAALVAGDEELIAKIGLLRRHLGMMIPAPIQQAMVVALKDDEHVRAQREVYRLRRERLKPALRAAGFEIEHSNAGLYLWVRRDGMQAWDIVDYMAERGIIVGSGTFYGERGANHVRVALTAPDERVSEGARRLADS